MKESLTPRKPRAMETAEVEQLLRTAASVADLPEPPPDFVARAVARALSAEAQRSSRSPFAARGLPRTALGMTALAGVAALAVALGVRASRTSSRLLAEGVTPPAAVRVALPPIAEAVVPTRPSFAAHAVMASVHAAVPHRLAAPHRRARWARRTGDTVRLVALPIPAPQAIAPAPSPAAPPKSVLRPSAASIAVAAPTPRPFWHDEQVERDEYTISAPALIAEGTGQEVTSLTPAIIQVAFSTTHPVVADAAYNPEDSNP